jgi:hypothetical protein
MGLRSPARARTARNGTMIARLPNRGSVVEPPLMGAGPPRFLLCSRLREYAQG